MFFIFLGDFVLFKRFFIAAILALFFPVVAQGQTWPDPPTDPITGGTPTHPFTIWESHFHEGNIHNVDSELHIHNFEAYNFPYAAAGWDTSVKRYVYRCRIQVTDYLIINVEGLPPLEIPYWKDVGYLYFGMNPYLSTLGDNSDAGSHWCFSFVDGNPTAKYWPNMDNNCNWFDHFPIGTSRDLVADPANGLNEQHDGEWLMRVQVDRREATLVNGQWHVWQLNAEPNWYTSDEVIVDYLFDD